MSPIAILYFVLPTILLWHVLDYIARTIKSGGRLIKLAIIALCARECSPGLPSSEVVAFCLMPDGFGVSHSRNRMHDRSASLSPGLANNACIVHQFATLRVGAV